MERLARRNEAATDEWLQSLTPELAREVFESLSEGIEGLDYDREPIGHPVALFTLWKE
jgi:hypothetical protein